MKKLTYLFIIFISTTVNSQIVDVNSGQHYADLPAGAYIKDLNHTFDIFLGTWKHQNSNEIFEVRLEKVEYHLTDYNNYRDYIKGNYSYTTDGGNTYVTNTIDFNTSNNPDDNSIFSSGPISQEYLDLIFKDKVHNKSCNLLLEFLPNSTNQLEFKLRNQSRGYLHPELPPNPNFSVPNNIVLTKVN